MSNLVYLSGKYEGCTKTQAMGWREEVLSLLGMTRVIIPQWIKTYKGMTDYECKDLVDRDLEDIDRASAVLYNVWSPSWGSGAELRAAWEKKKDIVVFGEGSISPWIRYHAGYVAKSLHQACEWLANRYGWELQKVKDVDMQAVTAYKKWGDT